MTRSYHELLNISSFDDRLTYLMLTGRVGEMTFGGHRRMNQLLYKMARWRETRNHIIVRDKGCDLAHADYDLGGMPAYIHHINPVTIDDILEEREIVFDPDNLITCSFNTHQAIHYANANSLPKLHAERKPNDTCPWR